MEMISKIMYSLKQGLKGVFSNKTMSFISVVSITSVLAILGIVSCIVLNINSFMEKTKDEVNEIRVSLDSNLTKDKSLYVKEELERLNGVISVKYQTKDEAFESMKASFGEDEGLLDGVKNPLDDYYIVTIEDSSQIKSLARNMEKLEGVVEVQYYEDIMENFLEASNTVVVPFIVEGCIIGLFGSILSLGICTGMYKYVLENVQITLNSIIGEMMLPLSSVSLLLVVILCATGMTVGILGSGLAVKKYLKV